MNFDWLGANYVLRRVDANGVERWRRSDLTPYGGEGFRTSNSQQRDGRDVTLVYACLGTPAGPQDGG
ncbi:MAG TPA: hypothetical protein PLV68_10150, partial [Ilumatobacteraceae bacterium]|nr:hypothetical protein [Ilumatobacteraceae bacterium]